MIHIFIPSDSAEPWSQNPPVSGFDICAGSFSMPNISDFNPARQMDGDNPGCKNALSPTWDERCIFLLVFLECCILQGSRKICESFRGLFKNLIFNIVLRFISQTFWVGAYLKLIFEEYFGENTNQDDKLFNKMVFLVNFADWPVFTFLMCSWKFYQKYSFNNY